MNKKWTENEDVALKKFYSKKEKEFILSKINRSWVAIMSRAYELKIKREIVEIKGIKLKIWTNEEINIIKDNYTTKSKSYILSIIPGRTWSSIQNKAYLLNIKRSICYGDLSVLLKDENTTYYWIGFLMADGHFSKKGSLQVNLAQKDLNHLVNLAKFLKYKNKITKPSLYINQKSVIDKLKEKFDIKHNKTYFPCNVKNINKEDLLFSLIIGFIDGDGSITTSRKKTTALSIKCHSSWGENLQFFVDFICKNENKKYKAYIDKQGLTFVKIADLVILKNIKKRAIYLNLPFLKRKWEKIDLEKKNKQEISEEIKKQCFYFFEKGFKSSYISKKINRSYSVVNKNFNIWKHVIRNN